MGIKIGNGNKIKNSNIVERIEKCSIPEKKSFFIRHAWISGIIVSFIVGFLLMFSFWRDLVQFIEEVF